MHAIAIADDSIVNKPEDDDEDANEDLLMFRRLLADSRPLAAELRVPLHKPRPVPRARFQRDDDALALQETLSADIDELEVSSGELLRFSRPAVGRRTMRKLARGNFSVQDEIDLHGMTVAEAKSRLREFIVDAAGRGYTCVRVIHGKGLGSGERGPVLKPSVSSWMRRWDEVLAFVSTKQVHGGTGAVYVLLRKDC